MRVRVASVVGALVLLLGACGSPVDGVGGGGTDAGEISPSNNVTLRSVTAEGEPEPPIGPDGDLHVIVMPDVIAGLPPDIMVGCRAGPSFPASALEVVAPVEDVDLLHAMQNFLHNEEGRFWPQDGWRVLHATEHAVLIVHHDPATAAISFMNFEPDGGSWRWAGASSGSPCSLQTTLPEGLGEAAWRIDPAGPELSPETTSIPVLVMEMGCASGQPMGDRLLGPEVVLTDTQVLIAFAVRPRPGGQDCPGNPEQSLTVQLPEPLGDREVIDGLATGLDLSDFLD